MTDTKHQDSHTPQGSINLHGKTQLSWISLEIIRALSATIPLLYVFGFIALNSHLQGYDLAETSIANSNYLIIGVLYAFFLAILSCTAGLAVVQAEGKVRDEIGVMLGFPFRLLWAALALVQSMIGLLFITCLGAAIFSIVFAGESSTAGFTWYLIALFLIEYPWDVMNLDFRYPRARQIFLLLTRSTGVYIFFSTIDSGSPTMSVLIHFALVAFFVNLLMDTIERHVITRTRVYYNVTFAIIFVLFNAALFGSWHFKHVDSNFGGIPVKSIKVSITEKSVNEFLMNIDSDIGEYLDCELIYESQEELFVRLSGDRILRLPKGLIGGIVLADGHDGE